MKPIQIPNNIELRPVVALLPFARNSRTHTEEQILQIVGSIKRFGWTNPVLINADGVIVAGHARVLAARQLEMEVVPVIVLDHLTEDEQRALVIADNKLALNAGWDEDTGRDARSCAAGSDRGRRNESGGVAENRCSRRAAPL